MPTASLNIYRTVREVLEASPNVGLDEDGLVKELQVRGFPHMGPGAAFEVIGRHLPKGVGRGWRGTVEVLAVLARLEAEVDRRAARRDANAAPELPTQRTAERSAAATQQGGVEPPQGGDQRTHADADAPCPTGELQEASGAAPAGLTVTLRVLLREGPTTVEALHTQLAGKGWTGVSLAQVRSCLRTGALWFDRQGDLWQLAPESSGRAPSAVPRAPAPSGGDVSVFATGASRAGDLLRPEGDEWTLPNLPTEPHLQHEYLVRYRAVRQRQSGLLEVWIAGKGELYHFDRDCNLLRGGQAVAVARGQGLSWVRSVTEHEAQRLQRQSCSRCAGGTGSGLRR